MHYNKKRQDWIPGKLQHGMQASHCAITSDLRTQLLTDFLWLPNDWLPARPQQPLRQGWAVRTLCPELSWGLPLLPFSLSVCCPLSSRTAMGVTAKPPGEPVPRLPSDPGHIPCPLQASVSSSPAGGCDFPAKDGATPRHSPPPSQCPWRQLGGQVPPPSGTRCSCCSQKPPSLSFHPVQIHTGARASDPGEPGPHFPWWE